MGILPLAPTAAFGRTPPVHRASGSYICVTGTSASGVRAVGHRTNNDRLPLAVSEANQPTACIFCMDPLPLHLGAQRL